MDSEADEYRSGNPVLQAPVDRAAGDQAGGPTRGQCDEGVAGYRGQRDDGAEQQQLRSQRACRRIGELREEGKKEKRRLRVQDLDQDTLPEDAAVAPIAADDGGDRRLAS